MRRGINQKVVYGYNPLPKVSEQELLTAADLELTTPSKRSPFAVRWQYSSGTEREDITLEPGDSLTLRENPEAREFLAEFKELGLVIVEDINDRAEVLAKSIEGLRVAQRHYLDRGAAQAYKMGREASPNRSKEQVDGDFRYDYYPYFLNEAKAKAIGALVRKHQAELDKLTAEQRKSAAA